MLFHLGIGLAYPKLTIHKPPIVRLYSAGAGLTCSSFRLNWAWISQRLGSKLNAVR